jgi:hypothetical protein
MRDFLLIILIDPGFKLTVDLDCAIAHWHFEMFFIWSILLYIVLKITVFHFSSWKQLNQPASQLIQPVINYSTLADEKFSQLSTIPL